MWLNGAAVLLYEPNKWFSCLYEFILLYTAPGFLSTGLHAAVGIDNKKNDEHLYIRKYNLFSLSLRFAENVKSKRARERERGREREIERERVCVSRIVYECIQGLDARSLQFYRCWDSTWHPNIAAFINTSTRGWQLISGQPPKYLPSSKWHRYFLLNCLK